MRIALFAIAAGAGLAAVIYVLRRSPSVHLIPVFLLIAFLIGLSLGLSQSRAGIASGFAFSAVPAVFIGIRILADLLRDPTSHNLWPFEFVLVGSLGLVPLTGLLAGYVATKRLYAPPLAAWITAYLAIAIALVLPLI